MISSFDAKSLQIHYQNNKDILEHEKYKELEIELQDKYPDIMEGSYLIRQWSTIIEKELKKMVIDSAFVEKHGLI
jgi:hypothetical protein